MNETRGGKYGRFLAQTVNHVIDISVQESEKREYRTRFIEELRTYSFEPRRKGAPRNKGCVWELNNLEEIDFTNPENFARFIKEGIHLMYQKETAGRVMQSLLENL